VSDAKLGTGFRYSKIMAWAPGVILALAIVLLVMGDVIMSGVLLVFALLVWLFVSRRKKAVASGARPAGTP
jgi:hypothetical protein